MPVYRVNKAGSVGFISPTDLPPYELPPEGWSSAQNVRLDNGGMRAVNGRKQLVNVGDLTIHALDYYSGPGGQHNLVYANQYIYAIQAGSPTPNIVKDMAAEAGSYPDQIWITDQLNSIPLATNNVGSPQCQYNNGLAIGPTTPFVPFPDWDTGGTYAGAKCLGIAAYKNFIVAWNITETVNYANMVIWSAAADPGLMPSSWDYNDATNLAGRTVLGADSGVILAGKVLRDSLFLYTEYATYRMTFVQGSPEVMDFTKVFDNLGAFGPRSVASFGEKHFVVSKNDIIVHDGQQQVSVGDMKIRNRVLQGLTEKDTNRVYAVPYLRLSEVWVGFPNTPKKELLNVGVWQWEDNGWSIRSIPDSRHIAELPILEASDVIDTWTDGPDIFWQDETERIWDQSGATGDLQLEGTSTDGWTWTLDEGVQVESCTLERQDINLSSEQTTETITEIFPRITSVNPVTITVGSSMTVEGPIKWGTPKVFNPNSDYHVTRLATGRRHSIRFEGIGYRLEGYDIAWEYAGER